MVPLGVYTNHGTIVQPRAILGGVFRGCGMAFGGMPGLIGVFNRWGYWPQSMGLLASINGISIIGYKRQKAPCGGLVACGVLWGRLVIYFYAFSL